MAIFKAKYLGFCEGVKMAIEQTNKALRKNKKKIYYYDKNYDKKCEKIGQSCSYASFFVHINI